MRFSGSDFKQISSWIDQAAHNIWFIACDARLPEIQIRYRSP